MEKSKKKKPTRKAKTLKNRKGKSGVKRIQVLRTDRILIKAIKKVDGQFVFSYHDQEKDEVVVVSAKSLDEISIKWNEVVTDFRNKNLEAEKQNSAPIIITDDQTIFRLKWKEEVLQLLIEGHSNSRILAIVMNKYNLANETVYNCIYEILNDFSKIDADQLKQLIITHQERYNFLYRRFLEINCDKHAMKVLESIERLYGHHSDTILIQINNINNQQKSLFDLSKVTEDDRKFLNSVMKKIKYVGEEAAN